MVSWATKPWLALPAPLSYAISHPLLKTWGALRSPRSFSWQPLEWRGLKFENRLGTSGGVDKDASLISAWWSFGAGFVEVGTVTPKPQSPNPGPILKRNLHHEALWNKMGFPNGGVEAVLSKIKSIERPYFTPLFMNIGKNRTTPNEHAHTDYLYCIKALKEVSDVFVVNISSPNTSGLRDLLSPKKLGEFLTPLVKECRGQKPLLLKLSPDMEEEDLHSALDTSYECEIDGWILTNTTLSRPDNIGFPVEGGLSGRPLAPRSKSILAQTVKHLGSRRQNKLLVSAGGVMTPQDVFERLEIGADLVQTYSALVFEGPYFFKKVAEVAK